jgi:hypothetical protein
MLPGYNCTTRSRSIRNGECSAFFFLTCFTPPSTNYFLLLFSACLLPNGTIRTIISPKSRRRYTWWQPLVPRALDTRTPPWGMATWGYDHIALVARPKGAPKVGTVDEAEPTSLSGLGYASVATKVGSVSTRVGSVKTRATMATTWPTAAVATNSTTRQPDNQGISWSLVFESLGSDVAQYRKPRPCNNHGRRLPSEGIRIITFRITTRLQSKSNRCI